MKKLIYLFLPITFVFSFAILSSCVDNAVDPVEDEDDYEYYDEEDIDEEHVVGDSSCPQNLAEFYIEEDGVDGMAPVIDSAYFECSHPSIDFYCNDSANQSYCDFKAGEVQKVNVQFNCASQASVETDLSCSFYRNDSMIASSKLRVKVNVK